MARKRPSVADKASELEFDFIKGNFFRVISVDGAFGGLSPQGRFIHMGLFSERQPFPTKVVHPLAEGRRLGDESLERRQSRKAFVRELEADVVMDMATALSVQIWLTKKIQEMAILHNLNIDFSSGTITPKTVATNVSVMKTSRKSKRAP